MRDAYLGWAGLVQVAENQTTPPQLVAEGPFSIYTLEVAGETKIRAQVGPGVGGGLAVCRF